MEMNLIGYDFCITFSELAKKKIDLIVALCSKEVGWLGLVTRMDKDIFYVHDVFIPKQEVNAATTEIAPEAISKLENQLWKDKLITMENQGNTGLYLWGHSHVNMGVGPSCQDDAQFKEYYAPKEGTPPPFFIRQISNKKDEHGLALYIRDLCERGIVVTNPVYHIDAPESAAIRDLIKKEIEANVSDKVYKYSSPATTKYPPVGFRPKGGAKGNSGVDYDRYPLRDYNDDIDLPMEDVYFGTALDEDAYNVGYEHKVRRTHRQSDLPEWMREDKVKELGETTRQRRERKDKFKFEEPKLLDDGRKLIRTSKK